MTASERTVDFLINLLGRLNSCIETVECSRGENKSIDVTNILREISDISDGAHAVWPKIDENDPDTFADIMRLKAEIHNASLRGRQLVDS